MGVGTDFAIDYTNRRIYHSTGATVYTVNALYSWLADTFDEQGAMDDFTPMSAQTPTEYTMTNEWFIDDVSTNFLKTGAIKTDGYLNKIQVVPHQSSGYTSCVASDIGKMVTDDNANTGNLLDYNNTTRKWWVRWATQIVSASICRIDDAISAAKSFNANTATFTDETTDINNATINDVALPPIQATILGDCIYVGEDAKFGRWRLKYDTAGVYVGTVVWEYWNGAWVTLSVTDPTSGFTAAASTYNITWTAPGDWVTTAIDGVTKYWIRARCSAITSVTTAPLGSQGWEGTGVGTASANSASGEDLFANIYTLGTIVTGAKVYVFQAGEKLSPDWWGTDHVDLLIKVMEAGVEIALAVITVYIRDYTDLYDHYEIDLTAGGRNAVPLATSDDLDNATAIATVANYIAIEKMHFVNWSLAHTKTSGNDPTVGRLMYTDVASPNNGSGYILVAGATCSLGDKKYTFSITADKLKIASVLKFKNRVISPQRWFTEGDTVIGGTSAAEGVVIREEQTEDATKGVVHLKMTSGTFLDGENLNVSATKIAEADGTQADHTYLGTASSAGSVLLTIDKDTGIGGAQPYNVIVDLNGDTVAKMYEYTKALTRRTQTKFDMFPVYDGSNISILDGEEYQAARSTYAQKKAGPLGTFAGGKFFGARGVWIEDMHADDVKKYSLIDANGVVRDPPDLQNFAVSALVVGDRVLICLTTGDNYTIDKSQYSMTAQAGGVAYVCVQEVIPDDTPASETVRVRYNVGLSTEAEDVYTVTSLDKPAKKFMISGVTSRAYTTSDKAYAPYMDRTAAATLETETVTYGISRYVICRVRKYGGAGASIIPFQTKGQFGGAGYSVAAIRTPDGIVGTY